MIRQLVASYVVLVAVAVVTFTVPVAFTLTSQVYGDAEGSARREAQLAALVLAADDESSRQALAQLVSAYEQQTPGRLDVLSAARAAVGALPFPVAADDPAFGAALAGMEWMRWGFADALGEDGLVLAVPARAPDGTVVGAVRVSYPSGPLIDRLWEIWGFRAALAVIVLAVAAASGVLLARRVTRPLRELNRMASRLRDGDLTARVEETGPAETRTLASTLNTATETIDTLLGSQRAFIGDASHQLRTPLTALRLSLDNIADEVDDPYVREDVERATAEVVRMSRLVNGLLTLARAEAAVTSPEPVRLADAVADRFESWRAVADERGVSLRHELTDPDLRVLASPGHLEQVLDNVLSNALEVSPDNATITVRSFPGGREGGQRGHRPGPGNARRRSAAGIRPVLAWSRADRPHRLRARPGDRQAAGHRRRRHGEPARGRDRRPAGPDRAAGRARPIAVRAQCCEPAGCASGIADEWWSTISHWSPTFS